MNLKPFRQSIGHLRAKLFKLAPAEQPYGQQEMEQLAAEIIEYGRMKQKHYGSHSVVLAAGELATRLRESTHTIVKALVVLREQGRAVGDCTSARPASRCQIEKFGSFQARTSYVVSNCWET